jgi:ParB family chromosome partitioning protein
MARKNIFASVMQEAPETAEAAATKPAEPSAHAKYGAAKSLSSSIDALARQASMLVEGQTIVELDPALVDASFLVDRMGGGAAGEDDAYQALLEAIRARGQDSPVLVRPHPERAGRFQVVFGHRRLRVAKALGRPLRAVVKSMADIEHVLAQGQENAARANLTFIERVLFAQKLAEQNYAREVIQAALTVDYQTLSKMLTIPKVVTAEVIEAIGPAPGVGRDRWLDLRKLMEGAEAPAQAQAVLAEPGFAALPLAERFDHLFTRLGRMQARRPAKKPLLGGGAGRAWHATDDQVSAQIKSARNTTTLVLSGKGQGGEAGFGAFVADQLDHLYEAYRKARGGDGK